MWYKVTKWTVFYQMIKYSWIWLIEIRKVSGIYKSLIITYNDLILYLFVCSEMRLNSLVLPYKDICKGKLPNRNTTQSYSETSNLITHVHSAKNGSVIMFFEQISNSCLRWFTSSESWQLKNVSYNIQNLCDLIGD